MAILTTNITTIITDLTTVLTISIVYYHYYHHGFRVGSFYRDNRRENGNYRSYRKYIRIDWGHIWIIQKKMETIGVLGKI